MSIEQLFVIGVFVVVFLYFLWCLSDFGKEIRDELKFEIKRLENKLDATRDYIDLLDKNLRETIEKRSRQLSDEHIKLERQFIWIQNQESFIKNLRHLLRYKQHSLSPVTASIQIIGRELSLYNGQATSFVKETTLPKVKKSK